VCSNVVLLCELTDKSIVFTLPPPTFPVKATPRPLTTVNVVPRTVPGYPLNRMGAIMSRDPDTLQPIKMMRLNASEGPATSPRRRRVLNMSPKSNQSTPSQTRKGALAVKENLSPVPKGGIHATRSPSAGTVNSKDGDYSVFKGRGRYAKELTA
jgi:hypothetical protein